MYLIGDNYKKQKKMSKYKYIVQDYHAIKKAEITIDGITVLSGVNGCGKSTLSRWLYYLINGANEFDSYLFNDYKKRLNHMTGRMSFAAQDIARFIRIKELPSNDLFDVLYDTIDKLKLIKYNSKEQINVAYVLFLDALHITGNLLAKTLTKDISEVRKIRFLSYLNIDIQDTDIHQAIENFIEKNKRWADSLTKKIYQEMQERPSRTFFEAIDSQFDLNEDYPSFIQLKEDQVNIFEDKHISTLFNLRNAIYIDTPMSIDAGLTNNLFWKALREMIIDDKKKEQPVETKKFLLRIRKLLDGEAVLDEKDTFKESNLRYVSNNKRINIGLNEVATGFKTFSYLQRLLENGYLNDETLLMIDEPEAHLHPQWIVEFARLLVLLNKKLGLKIMIASHNPDMVAAIHDIAQKEGILDNTNFYVAQPENQESHTYIYKDLGHEIGEIFESFNIALENINRYGAMDLQ